MIIIDNQHLIKDRLNYTARGAAVIGMMTYGRDFFYALDDEMNLNETALQNWLAKHPKEPILIFGMTFMIWQYFIKKISPLNISEGILFHTGGWKKLQDQAIDNCTFKKELKTLTQISHCHNFYGMVEQVGSVFVECQEGNLHCPYFSDVIIRNPINWNETEGEGVIQVLSSLPTSYPGHSLLTEDLGHLVGIDDCLCGRNGKHFRVIGRVPQAEIRGCSDTYEFAVGDQ